ncbi:uncharacterized protein si:dkeyp-117h8.4 [Austrofundulus limnaeus]|uniref:Uncharacterized protein si:dkeyp-117h8.4 n=1 Tax=Austrofundulus limnaeus TaxID=52670 RepID=A0A2I4D2V7_AUSLI|nr:PREDICTED: uncharacterized protein LOC106534474 [Austrofundulus limnaeus]
MEVDLNDVKITSEAIVKYMANSHATLNMTESKSLADLNEETLSGQNITGNSQQLDFTYTDSVDGTCNSTSSCAVDDHEVILSSLEESSRNLSEEEQDEELQMSLSSHGSSLLELYPSMVSRIKRACHRQHVSDAANSVLRRYQRWRQQSRRGNTFNVTLTHTDRNPKATLSSKLQLKESPSGPVRRLETIPHQVLQTVTSLHDGQAKKASPVKETPPITRSLPVINFFETSNPREIPLNKTFVFDVSPCKHVSRNTDGPSQPSRGSFRSSKDFNSFFNLPTPSVPYSSAESSTCSRESPAATKRHVVYGSPIWQSPFKTRTMSAFSRSPQAFSRGLQGYSLEHSSRGPARPRSPSESLPSSPKRPVVQLRMLYPQSPQPQPAPRADGRPRLRRHLSFDDSLSRPVSYSPKKVDEEFVKLYHKLVCQNKSVLFNSLPCRLCARNSEVSRGHSSSSLAALALSPHRSVLWKRHRETGSDSYPQSKRHKREAVRRCLSEVQLRHGAFTSSPGKHRAQQDAWMSWPQAQI